MTFKDLAQAAAGAGRIAAAYNSHECCASVGGDVLDPTWSLVSSLPLSASTGQRGYRRDRARREPSVRSRRRLRILVAGRLASAPGQGGATWALLQWILGFRSLGHDVLLVEPLAPSAFASPARLSQVAAGHYFRSVTRQFELSAKATMLVRGSSETVGVDHETLARAANDCDLLVDMSGVLGGDELVERIPVRIYADSILGSLSSGTRQESTWASKVTLTTQRSATDRHRERNPVLRQELDPRTPADCAGVLAQGAAPDARAPHNVGQLAELRLH